MRAFNEEMQERGLDILVRLPLTLHELSVCPVSVYNVAVSTGRSSLGKAGVQALVDLLLGFHLSMVIVKQDREVLQRGQDYHTEIRIGVKTTDARGDLLDPPLIMVDENKYRDNMDYSEDWWWNVFEAVEEREGGKWNVLRKHYANEEGILITDTHYGNSPWTAF